MTEIPETVYAQAREIATKAGSNHDTTFVLGIARGILAERERCAFFVRSIHPITRREGEILDNLARLIREGTDA